LLTAGKGGRTGGRNAQCWDLATPVVAAVSASAGSKPAKQKPTPRNNRGKEQAEACRGPAVLFLRMISLIAVTQFSGRPGGNSRS